MPIEKVILMGTFDTKAEEYLFIKDIIEDRGIAVITVDLSLRKHDKVECDFSNEDVLKYAACSLDKLANMQKSAAVNAMTKGAKLLVSQLLEQGKIAGILSLGGTNGTTLATPVMQMLPFGFPKVMVSTIASGDTRYYVGQADIIMINSVTDIAGVNFFTKNVYVNAALCLIGMVKNRKKYLKCKQKRPIIAATMMGVTTPCVNRIKKRLEKKGYELVIFHANGNGGKAMEKFINTNSFSGVIDLTTTEVINEIANSKFTAGPERLSAGIKNGIPQVISPGAMDMLVFGLPEDIPEKYSNRTIYRHNPSITLVRTDIEENMKAGRFMAEKLNKSEKAKTTVLLPLKGFSQLDKEGEPFYGREEDQAFIESLKKNLNKSRVEIVECNHHINDPEFADTAVDLMVAKMGRTC